jgi:hypothetical protein
MLAFDIETRGLKAGRDDITIVCTEDYFTGEKKAYEFARLKNDGDSEGFEKAKYDMIEAFNTCTSLCAFNGMNFDIPFIQKTFNVPNDIVMMWKNKLCDIFYACKQKYMHTFSLNLLCETNNVPMKISTGVAAIHMAANEEWEDLKAYCEMDVTILNNLFRKRHLLNPRNNALMDLSFFARERLYSDSPHPFKSHQAVDTYLKISNNTNLESDSGDLELNSSKPNETPGASKSRDYQRMSLVE